MIRKGGAFAKEKAKRSAFAKEKARAERSAAGLARRKNVRKPVHHDIMLRVRLVVEEAPAA